jgi:twitching motility protein PilT
MKRFQKILQRAIADNALSVKIAVSSAPIASFSNNKTTTFTEFGILDSAYILSLFGNLIPNGFPEKPVHGEAKIPNFGDILIIANPKPIPTLTMFLPSGHYLFQDAWELANLPPEKLPKKPGISPLTADNPFAFSPTFSEQNESSITKKIAPPRMPPPPAPRIQPGATTSIIGPPNSSAALAPMDPTAPASIPAPEAIDPRKPLPFRSGLKVTSDKPAAIAPIVTPAAAPATPSPIRKPDLPKAASETPAPPLAGPAIASAPPPLLPPENLLTPKKATVIAAEFPRSIAGILKEMIDKGASDLHISTGEAMYFRIDGKLERDESNRIISSSNFKNYFDTVLSEDNSRDFEARDTTTFIYSTENLGRFRIHLFKDQHGSNAAVRALPSKVTSFSDLGLPDEIKNICTLERGLVLVAGPWGSGKSTTINAMIDFMNNSRSEHLLGVEELIEFVHTSKQCLVRQLQISLDAETLNEALDLMRYQDADIVYLGELKNSGIVRLALELAESGKLVLGSVTSKSATAATEQLTYGFAPELQPQIRQRLSQALVATVFQTLQPNKFDNGRSVFAEIIQSTLPKVS